MDLQKHYKNLFTKYGDSFKTAQWSDERSQEKRFEVLLEVGDMRNCSILDYGCGTGHLATYLNKMEIPVNYTGVDIVEELIDCAQKKHAEHSFFLVEDFITKQYDYIFISGVFNNKILDNRTFYRDKLMELLPYARKGIAFNMLSHYVDYYDESLFYEKPEAVFEFIKNEMSPFVVLRNDYELKEGVIPYEFTIYIYIK